MKEKKVEWPLCRNFRIAKITKYKLTEIISFNSSLNRITITRKVNSLIIFQTWNFLNFWNFFNLINFWICKFCKFQKFNYENFIIFEIVKILTICWLSNLKINKIGKLRRFKKVVKIWEFSSFWYLSLLAFSLILIRTRRFKFFSCWLSLNRYFPLQNFDHSYICSRLKFLSISSCT